MRVAKMDKKQLKIAVAVLDAIKSRFPETQEFIDRFGTIVVVCLFIDVERLGR